MEEQTPDGTICAWSTKKILHSKSIALQYNATNCSHLLQGYECVSPSTFPFYQTPQTMKNNNHLSFFLLLFTQAVLFHLNSPFVHTLEKIPVHIEGDHGRDPSRQPLSTPKEQQNNGSFQIGTGIYDITGPAAEGIEPA